MAQSSGDLVNVHVHLGDIVLRRLMLEQLAASKIYSCVEDALPEITLCDDDFVPSCGERIVLGRGQVRLGEVMDRLAYLSSGRRDKMAARQDGIDVGKFVFFPAEQVLHGVDGDEVRLTEKERAVLEVLFAAGARGVVRQELLTQVWGYVEGTETHTLETHMYRLRQKLAVFGADGLIEACEGRYILVKNPPEGGS